MNFLIFLTCIGLAGFHFAMGGYEVASSYMAASFVILAMEK
jgi:hypothetical protein